MPPTYATFGFMNIKRILTDAKFLIAKDKVPGVPFLYILFAALNIKEERRRDIRVFQMSSLEDAFELIVVRRIMSLGQTKQPAFLLRCR